MGVKRFQSYANNGELIMAAHDKGHVRGHVLDATFGKGTWWRYVAKLDAVTAVTGMDLIEHKARRAHVGSLAAGGISRGVQGDFRRPPIRPGSMETIFYDPRYKLNGRPTPDEDGFDERYGADDMKPWREIQAEMLDGLFWWEDCPACGGNGTLDELIPDCHEMDFYTPCPTCHGAMGWRRGLAPLLRPNGRLLMKCMDQVSSGAMRWQTFEAYKRAEAAGLELVELLEYEIHPREQPPGRRSVHAEANYSTLMIFGRPPIRRTGDRQPPRRIGGRRPSTLAQAGVESGA